MKILKSFLTILMVTLLIAACGTTDNTKSTPEKGDTEVKEEVSGNNGIQTIQDKVEFSGQVDNASIEVLTDQGAPLVLVTTEITDVDFGALEPGIQADIEYFTNEEGQNILKSFDSEK